MQDLLAALQRCWEQGESAVLATVIETKGSTYRKAGAKSVILNDGTFLGVLSGGCVEQDIFEHAKQVMDTQQCKSIDYDLMQDDDMPWGLGVGCNGALKIWLQPFNPLRHPKQAQTMIQLFRKAYETTFPYACVTVLSSDYPTVLPGTQWLIERTGNFTELEGFNFQPYLMDIDHSKEKYKARIVDKTVLDEMGRRIQLSCFVEIICPIPRAVIFGGGPDAVPLVRQLKFLNWHVSVVDHRPDDANRDHFPEADEIVNVSPGAFPDHLVLNQSAYAVIMSHHYQQDLVFLEQLLHRNLPYIGILGPRKRTKKLLSDIQKQAGIETDALLENLHAPIGLDIGAEAPEEIAASIATEMMCRKNNRQGGFLCEKQGEIHEPDQRKNESKKAIG